MDNDMKLNQLAKLGKAAFSPTVPTEFYSETLASFIAWAKPYVLTKNIGDFNVGATIADGKVVVSLELIMNDGQILTHSFEYPVPTTFGITKVFIDMSAPGYSKSIAEVLYDEVNPHMARWREAVKAGLTNSLVATFDNQWTCDTSTDHIEYFITPRISYTNNDSIAEYYDIEKWSGRIGAQTSLRWRWTVDASRIKTTTELKEIPTSFYRYALFPYKNE